MEATFFFFPKNKENNQTCGYGLPLDFFPLHCHISQNKFLRLRRENGRACGIVMKKMWAVMTHKRWVLVVTTGASFSASTKAWIADGDARLRLWVVRDTHQLSKSYAIRFVNHRACWWTKLGSKAWMMTVAVAGRSCRLHVCSCPSGTQAGMHTHTHS